jgi:hypothetical protein
MEIDLTNPTDFTIANVRALLASVDDSEDTQLRVTKVGKAYLSDITGSEQKEGLRFRAETWDAGNGYVGEAAAADTEWVERVFGCLKANWPNPESASVEVEPIEYYR